MRVQKRPSRSPISAWRWCKPGARRRRFRLYLRAAKLTPKNATIYEDLGAAYLQENNVDDADPGISDGPEVRASGPALHYDLGLGTS